MASQIGVGISELPRPHSRLNADLVDHVQVLCKLQFLSLWVQQSCVQKTVSLQTSGSYNLFVPSPQLTMNY